MNKKILGFILLMAIASFCCLSLYAVYPFARHLLSIDDYKTFANPLNTRHITINYQYSATEPPLCDALTYVTTLVEDYQTTITTINSVFEHTYAVNNGMTQVDYYEHRNANPELYAHYKFLWNQDWDLLEVLQERPPLNDRVQFLFHYSAVNRPDSIYYISAYPYAPSISHYKLNYDEAGKLISGYRYLYNTDDESWYPYSRYLSTYSPEPLAYPTSLDFVNFRLYALLGSGFEDSTPVYDRNYVPDSIVMQYWNDYYEHWENSDSYYYGVEPTVENIALVQGEYGEYEGKFYYTPNGVYDNRFTTFPDETYIDVNLVWSDDVANDDPTQTPALSSVKAYPNPFSTNLTIKLDAKNTQPASVFIYNLKGQLVKAWRDVKSGQVTWDGKNSANKTASQGIYLLKTRQGSLISTAKVLKY